MFIKTQSGGSISNSLNEKKYFTTLFFKMFFFLEISLIILALMGIYKFSFVYYENHYDQVKNEIKRISFLTHSSIFPQNGSSEHKNENKAKKIKPKEDPQNKSAITSPDFSNRLAEIKNHLSPVKEIFLLSQNNVVEAHSDSLLVGKNIKEIYPDLEKNFFQSPFQNGEVRNERIKKPGEPHRLNHLTKEKLKNDPEYKYFYKYILPLDIIYPLYTKYKYAGTVNFPKQLVIIFSYDFPWPITWIDLLVILSLISYLSFFFSFAFERIIRANLVDFSRYFEKTPLPLERVSIQQEKEEKEENEKAEHEGKEKETRKLSFSQIQEQKGSFVKDAEVPEAIPID